MFSISDRTNNPFAPKQPTAISPEGGGFTPPAYLEQREPAVDENQPSKPVLPEPVSQAGDKMGNEQAKGAPAPEPAQPSQMPAGSPPAAHDGSTPLPQPRTAPQQQESSQPQIQIPTFSPSPQLRAAMPQGPDVAPVGPEQQLFSPSSPAIQAPAPVPVSQGPKASPFAPLSPQLTQNSFSDQAAPNGNSEQQLFTPPAPTGPANTDPSISGPKATTQAAPGNQIVTPDPTRPGSGYLNFNGQLLRIAGAGQGGVGPDGGPKQPVPGVDHYMLTDDNGNWIQGPVIGAEYEKFVNQNFAPTTAMNNTPQAPKGPERYMINGEVLEPDGTMAPSQFQQQRTVQTTNGPLTTPYRNYDAIGGQNTPDAATMQKLSEASAANAVQQQQLKQNFAPAPQATLAPSNQNPSPTNSVGAKLSQAFNSLPVQNGGVNNGSSSSSSPSASGSDQQYGFGNLGSLIEKLLNNPSAYDDKTMQDAISNNETKLKQSEDAGLAGVDADTAARGLLMGSPDVIDRSKIRDKIQQARGDFLTNTTLDRAHTMAQDRSQAFNNAFNFIGANQAQGNQDLNWTALASQLGNYGAPDQNSALGNMPMSQPDFSGLDPSIVAEIGKLFGNTDSRNSAAKGK